MLPIRLFFHRVKFTLVLSVSFVFQREKKLNQNINLDGDYVFVYLRGEFVHLLNFNMASNFVNHLFFSDDTILLPYDVKYTTQRTNLYENSTILYDKMHLSTYTIAIDRHALVCGATSSTMIPIITYALVALKDGQLLGQLLARLLHLMYDDLDTKSYLKEIITGK